MHDLERRATNALLGLALGDALSWPAMYHRSRRLPPWTRRIRREIDAQREEAGILPLPLPFSLNQPREGLDIFPTDDTEWATWTMQRLLACGLEIDMEEVTGSWSTLAHGKDQIRGWVSTQAAMANIRMGLLPPRSGTDNPHYFDDSAMCRALPIGIVHAGQPGEAAAAAGIEASATNSGEGVWVARSFAAAVSVACAGAPPLEVAEAALQTLPDPSWPHRILAQSLKYRPADLLDLPAWVTDIQSVEYSDGCIGPEILAAALAVMVHCEGHFRQAVTLATSIARGADAIPAMVGALCGALAEEDPITDHWRKRLAYLRGICHPGLAGVNYPELVHQFAVACAQKAKTRSGA